MVKDAEDMPNSTRPNALDERDRESIFNRRRDSHRAWLTSAIELKVAADRLNWAIYPVRKHERGATLLLVYRMLIGMSFEALLKGLLAAEKKLLDEKGKLRTELKKHSLRDMAQLVRKEIHTFDEVDYELLRKISPYIKWAGRYPAPNSVNEWTEREHTSNDITRENELWERLELVLQQFDGPQQPRSRPREDSMTVSIRELGLDRLSVDDRMKLAEELWDSIASDVETRSIDDAHRQEIERRLQLHADDPKAGRSWADVRADLEKSGG